MQCYIGIFFADSKDIDMADQIPEAEMEVIVDSAEDKVEEGVVAPTWAGKVEGLNYQISR